LDTEISLDIPLEMPVVAKTEAELGEIQFPLGLILGNTLFEPGGAIYVQVLRV
jgi:hypothetical protein